MADSTWRAAATRRSPGPEQLAGGVQLGNHPAQVPRPHDLDGRPVAQQASPSHRRQPTIEPRPATTAGFTAATVATSDAVTTQPSPALSSWPASPAAVIAAATGTRLVTTGCHRHHPVERPGAPLIDNACPVRSAACWRRHRTSLRGSDKCDVGEAIVHGRDQGVWASRTLLRMTARLTVCCGLRSPLPTIALPSRVASLKHRKTKRGGAPSIAEGAPSGHVGYCLVSSSCRLSAGGSCLPLPWPLVGSSVG